MTTANLMNVPSVNNVLSQVDASKKLQEENLEVAEVFAGLMNQTISLPDSVVDDMSSNMDVSKTDSTKSPVESYERYSYKDKQIDTAKETSVEEKLEEAGDVLEQASEEVIDTLAEKYGVDEETIQNLLEDMGLNALDLLNPQNLVSFIVQLTGVASGEELLLDENFLSVMEAFDNLAEGLMKELNVDMNGLQELVAEMDLVQNDTEVSADFQDIMDNTLNTVETSNATDDSVEQKNAIDVQAEETNGAEALETKAHVTDDNQNSEGNSFLNDNSNEAIATNQTTVNVSQAVEMPQVQQFSSYLSADTVQIMEQIVQQMRVTISNDITTMEMQMNPENLGKVYVNISSEEGVVNAQFQATSEVVKEALEAQISTLRESLNQAGVKVDSIEVTIASHEFERNLDQQSKNPEENVNAQEANTQKRRNITIDSLDELSGVMTEEETLVAQIMRDNGNSVDFTA